MKERIIEFLKAENKTSAQLAEEIGVQPSGISHILSGRNNPSLDFVIKMLDRYNYLSTDWLLFGKGQMYRDEKMQSLFEDTIFSTEPVVPDTSIPGSRTSSELHESNEKQPVKSIESALKVGTGVFVNKIVLFYNNNSFEEYYPAK
jgi:transcriptional regulator with XRE-family HTH domain